MGTAWASSVPPSTGRPDGFAPEPRRAEATESIDLTGVLTMLRRWQRVAWSARDPLAHQQMLDNADRLTPGEDVPTESWEATKARLGL